MKADPNGLEDYWLNLAIFYVRRVTQNTLCRYRFGLA